MGRKDALIRLHDRLMERREELRRAILDELGDLRYERGGRLGSDDGDAATETLNNELTSQLAAMECRELAQIERALIRLREGVYGSCEGCNKKIPVARLNALPYTTLCIDCQREFEANPELAEEYDGGWQKVFDSEAASKDVSVNLSDLEFNLG